MQKAITGLTLTCRIFTNWSAPFTEIRRANYIIAGVQSSSLDEATKAHYEGLARMNRAWEYYQLVRMYGDVQWIDKVIDPADNEASTDHAPTGMK